MTKAKVIHICSGLFFFSFLFLTSAGYAVSRSCLRTQTVYTFHRVFTRRTFLVWSDATLAEHRAEHPPEQFSLNCDVTLKPCRHRPRFLRWGDPRVGSRDGSTSSLCFIYHLSINLPPLSSPVRSHLQGWICLGCPRTSKIQVTLCQEPCGRGVSASFSRPCSSVMALSPAAKSPSVLRRGAKHQLSTGNLSLKYKMSPIKMCHFLREY